VAYYVVIDGTNAVFQTWCWWTNAEQRNQKGNGTSASYLIENHKVTITSIMDAFVDAVLDTKWEYDPGVPVEDVRVKILFDKNPGNSYARSCSKGANSLLVLFVDDADPEIINIVSNSWVTHSTSDIICIITDDKGLTRLIYEVADQDDDHKRPTVMVEKVAAEIGCVPLIPLHINIRKSHSLYKSGRPFLHLKNFNLEKRSKKL